MVKPIYIVLVMQILVLVPAGLRQKASLETSLDWSLGLASCSGPGHRPGERARGKATTDGASTTCRPPGDTLTYLSILPCQVHPQTSLRQSVSFCSQSVEKQMPPTQHLCVLDLWGWPTEESEMQIGRKCQGAPHPRASRTLRHLEVPLGWQDMYLLAASPGDQGRLTQNPW